MNWKEVEDLVSANEIASPDYNQEYFSENIDNNSMSILSTHTVIYMTLGRLQLDLQ